MQLHVYVPLPGSAATADIAAGSAIVSAEPPTPGANIPCHFEGNLNGAANIRNYADKLAHAAGRLTANYPTRARRAIPSDELALVATYDARRLHVIAVVDKDRLEAWSGDAVTAVAGTRLDAGPAEWETAAQMAINSRQISRRGEMEHHACITRAGQVLVFDMLERTAEVLAEDDPRIDAYFPGEEPSGPTP